MCGRKENFMLIYGKWVCQMASCPYLPDLSILFFLTVWFNMYQFGPVIKMETTLIFQT